MKDKNYIVILYAESNGGEACSNLHTISGWDKEETIIRAADLVHENGWHDMFVYIDSVYVFRETEGNTFCTWDNNNDTWTQEAEDEAKLMVGRIKGIVQEREDEQKRIKKEQEEKKKQEAAKAAFLRIQEKEQEILEALVKKYPDCAKRVLRSEAAADE